MTHPVLKVLHAVFVVVVVGASVQTLGAHFPPVPALHLPSDPTLVKQSDPSVAVDG